MARSYQTTPISGTFDGAVKKFYEPALQTLLTEVFSWYEWLKSEGRVDREPEITGDSIVFATTVKRSSGVGARGEMNPLPTADKSEIVQGSIDYLTGYKGRISVSAEVMKYGRKGKGNFANIVEHEMENIKMGIMEHGSSHAWGPGTGILARAPNHTGGTTALTLSSTEDNNECYPGHRWLHEGQKYMTITTGTPTNYTADATFTNSFEVTAKGAYTAVTMDAAHTATSTNLGIVANESTTNGSVTIGTASSYVGPTGFLAMCDDGTFLNPYCGINATTYPLWKASVLMNSGTARSLTTKLLYQAFFKVANKSGQQKPGLCGWMNHDVYLELVDLLEHFVQFKPRKLKGGFDEIDLDINGNILKFRLDKYCPGYIFLVDPSQVKLYETIPVEVATDHGSEWIPLSDHDGYEARIRWNWQLATLKRNAHGILGDLTHTAGGTL